MNLCVAPTSADRGAGWPGPRLAPSCSQRSPLGPSRATGWQGLTHWCLLLCGLALWTQSSWGESSGSAASVAPPPSVGFTGTDRWDGAEEDFVFSSNPSDRGNGWADTAERDPILESGLERGWTETEGWTEVPLDWTTLDPALAFEAPPQFRMRDDLRDLLPEVRRDLASLASWRNLLIVGAGAGVSLALRENVDGEVRAAVADSPGRLGDAEKVLNAFGDPLWQVPTLLVGYGYSLWRQDEPFHQFMTSTLASYTYTGIAVLTLKGIADTSRPSDHFQDGRWGFPSFHTASTFTIVANIDTWYGWPAGVPALALAGLVGYSRIDAQEHDLSDVVFGAVLGYTIGKSVALSRQARGANWRVDPWYDPLDSAGGVGVELRY